MDLLAYLPWIGFGAFVLGMLTLVFASRRHDPGLVQKDYYALDLNYQDRLERKQQAAALIVKPHVLVQDATKSLSIQMPEGMDDAKGSAKFYRSKTTQDDFVTPFEAGKPIQMGTSNMSSGRWHVELEWESGGKKFYWETAFQI
jgi:hypothetical protein